MIRQRLASYLASESARRRLVSLTAALLVAVS
jgi:hypothetical protein